MKTTRLKRAGAIALATGAMLAIGIAPAAAHHLNVTPPGGAEPKHAYVGGEPLPEAANGKGLIPAGPDGVLGRQSPAHDGGLVTACVALLGNGNGVVSMPGPTGPGAAPTCRHGSQPV